MRFTKAVLATCLVAAAVAQSTTSFQTVVELTTQAEIAGGTNLTDADGAAEAFGVAEVEFSGLSNVISWRINLFRLSSPSTLAHFHGPANETETAPVEIEISGGQLAEPETGSAQLNAQQVDDLLDGMWYINIHTTNNPAGELRGQVLPSQFVAESFETTLVLTPEAELASNTSLMQPSNGIGQAQIVFDAPTSTLSWVITYEDLTSSTTAAHFHGPARETGTSGVEVLIAGAQFQSGISGMAIITSEQIADLEAGLWYVNIHTMNNPAGELRGQVIAQQPPVPTQQASVYQSTVSLTPQAEITAGTMLMVDSMGSGTAIVQLTTSAPYFLSWHITFNDLTSSTMFAHFHGPADENNVAGVQIEISGVPFTSPHQGTVMITEQQADDLLAGLWYVNIHTMLNGPGELRGQVTNFDMVLVDVGNVGVDGTGAPGMNSASKISFATSLVVSAVATLLLK